MSSQVSTQVPSVRPAPPPPPDLEGPLQSTGSPRPETSVAVSQPESDPPHIPTFAETRQLLDGISLGKETYKDPESGSLKIGNRNKRLVAQDMWNETLKHFKARGEFFRAPRPLYVDNVLHKLFDFSTNSPQMATALRGLGYIPHHGFCPSVQRALEDYAATSPVRDCDHISHMTPDAVYINSCEGKMLKITADSFTEAPPGHRRDCSTGR